MYCTGTTGSCVYMAPEVHLLQPYNEKVDVFSFGVMMYEVCVSVTGRKMLTKGGNIYIMGKIILLHIQYHDVPRPVPRARVFGPLGWSIYHGKEYSAPR